MRVQPFGQFPFLNLLRKNGCCTLGFLMFLRCTFFVVFLSFALKVFAGSGVVRIGSIMPLSGQLASFGEEGRNSIRLAFASSAAKGLDVQLIFEDSKSTPQDSAAAANKLIKSDHVVVVIGELTSSNTMAAAGIAQAAKVPLVTPSSTNDAVTQGKEFISRMCFIDSFQGRVMGAFARHDLKAQTAAIMIDSDSDYSRGLTESFRRAFTGAGGKISFEISYSQKDSDFVSQLTKVRREKPDVVYLPGYHTQVGAILRQAAELKIKSVFLGGDGWDSPDLFQIGGAAVQGQYISNHFSAEDSNPKIQEFVKAYREKYNKNPGAMGALSYDAALLVIDILKKSPSRDPQTISRALAATQHFSGVTGVISMDANRNAQKPAVILKSQAGAWKFVARSNVPL